MADDKIALSIEIEADRAQMSLGELEDGFDGLQKKLKAQERVTDEGKAAFKKLASQMAQTSKEIKNMELSFEGLDREQVASEIGSVAGAVGDLTTSFILLGGESETMEEVGRNIEKAMMVSMGLKGAIEGVSSAQKLYTNLIEDGTIEQVKQTIATTIATAKTWLLDAAKKAYAVTTKLLTGEIKIATVAQRVFNAVVKANPIALIVTALLAAGAALIAFASSSKEASREQEILKEIQEDVINGMASEQAELQRLVAIAKDETQTRHARNKAIKELNKISPEYLGNLTLETINTKEATAAIDSYTESLVAQARAKALQEKLTQAVTRQLELETQGLEASEASYAVLGAMFGRTTEGANASIEARKENIKAAEDEVQSILNLIKAENKQVESHAIAAAARSGFAIDVAALEKRIAEKKAQRVKDQQEADKKLIEDAKALAEFEEEQARIKIQLIQDEGQRARAEIEYNTQLELEALEKKGLLTFDAQMLIAQKKHKALADLEKAEEEKRLAAEKEAQAKRDEYEQLLFDAKIANEQEETERQKLKIEEDFQNNLATLEEQGLLTTELEIELTMAREKALADIELERIETVRQAKIEAAQQSMDLALTTLSAISEVSNAYADEDLKAEEKRFNDLRATKQFTEKQLAAEELASAKIKDDIRRKQFEREKKLNIAMAVINGAQAQMSILAQTPKADFGIATAILMASAAITTAATIAKIKATTFQSTPAPALPTLDSGDSDSPSGPDAGDGVQLTPVTNTSTILGGQQVFVTETDITETQNNVSVIEESATF